MRGTCAVVVPAYSAASFITEALDSIVAQRRPADQFIVVDDGSPDQTVAVVEAWLAAHPGAKGRLLRNGRNRGLCHTRNRGVAGCTTDYVATLDADDVLEPDHLERLLEPLDDDPTVVLSFGDTREFDERGMAPETMLDRIGARLRQLPSVDAGNYRVLSSGLFRSLLPGSFIPVSGSAYRRETAIAAGLYDQRLRRVEDRDFMLRMAGEGPFAFVPHAVCRKRLHGDNISGPSHHLAMAEGAFGALMRTRAWLRHGDPGNYGATQAQLAIAARNYLYSASITDLSTLKRARADLWRAGFPGLALQPKAWARLVWYAIRRPHAR